MIAVFFFRISFLSPLQGQEVWGRAPKLQPAYSRMLCLPHPKVGFPPSRGLSARLREFPSTRSCATEKAYTSPSLRRTAGILHVGSVDRVDFSDPGKIVTIGTAQLYETLPVASANRDENASFP